MARAQVAPPFQEIIVTDAGTSLARAQRISTAASVLYTRRVREASEAYRARVQSAYAEFGEAASQPATPMDLWRDWTAYVTDAAQRATLFWDTLRQRGNQWLAHERAGKPPVLQFDFETVLDAREFERPVNYALLRILPPEGVVVDPKRRPYVIIDPRAGHGPGIGGFKDDSQVGVAIRDGHPVYFVTFFPEPCPGQTLTDVTAAERRFVRKVRELHPDSPKPAIVGNCQGGWAAMMLAASYPEDTGPLVINGAPMSYWGGATAGGEDNPMRYAGGMLGGSWLSSLSADLGNGVFDGAYLVQNFENLNPANTYFDKYYHLFANADTETPRFLEFERWWGGFFLMNREEIEWITRNLFVGNKLWKGQVQSAEGKAFDLREIRSPIVLFASMGDNITPPQQAFNWVADVYGSTAEIKARGQTIVGLLHESIGHLGIFVAGSVARKEHSSIVSVLKSIEALPPGLYAMRITETADEGGGTDYEVEFVEKQLEDVVKRLNRFERMDEKPFEVVAQISEFNQRAYELFVQPVVQATSNEATAQASRMLHPLRAERWAVSDLNPWTWWMGTAAGMVKANRQPVEEGQAFRRAETLGAGLVSAAWDYYRDLRDATSEAAFFRTYGGIFGAHLADKALGAAEHDRAAAEAAVKDMIEALLARIGEGGYPAAVARAASLLARHGQPIQLEAIEARRDIMLEYRDLLPDLPREEQRRIRGEQEVIVAHAPREAAETLPQLLTAPGDRERFLALFGRLLADPRVQAAGVTPGQREMIEHLRLDLVGGAAPAVPVADVATQAGAKSAVGRPKAARPRAAAAARPAKRAATRTRAG
jgi:pimeloyl-ACP methyl ester carboxylesterase